MGRIMAFMGFIKVFLQKSIKNFTFKSKNLIDLIWIPDPTEQEHRGMSFLVKRLTAALNYKYFL